MIEKIKLIQQKYSNISDSNYYVVLTKAQALEQIFTQVDFGLFDKELAKKKDTQIEE